MKFLLRMPVDSFQVQGLGQAQGIWEPKTVSKYKKHREVLGRDTKIAKPPMQPKAIPNQQQSKDKDTVPTGKGRRVQKAEKLCPVGQTHLESRKGQERSS